MLVVAEDWWVRSFPRVHRSLMWALRGEQTPLASFGLLLGPSHGNRSGDQAACAVVQMRSSHFSFLCEFLRLA